MRDGAGSTLVAVEPTIAPVIPDLTPAEADALLDGIGTAFSKLRRRTMQVPLDPPVHRTDLRRDLALTAVEESPQGLTISELAARLMIDAPAASRLAAGCIKAGQLIRIAAQNDGRRTILQLTSQGTHVLAHSRHQQRQAFEHITHDWPTNQRLALAYLLDKYAHASSTTR